MKPIVYEHEGRVYYAYAEKIKGTLWIHIDGRTYSLKPAGAEYEAGGVQQVADPSQLAAPMPGKIMKVSASAGQKVTAEEVLVTMEAMKMEYTLKAAADGVVTKVLCQVGQQVSLGQLLMQIEVDDG